MIEDINRHFSGEDIQEAKRYMKRCSSLLVIREMEIKATVKSHVTLVRMAIIKVPKQEMPERVWREGNTPILFVGM